MQVFAYAQDTILLSLEDLNLYPYITPILLIFFTLCANSFYLVHDAGSITEETIITMYPNTKHSTKLVGPT